jgi:HTH-type transcriptional regulator/antitoxin HigA
MASSVNQYRPDYLTPPGDTLSEFIDERGMSQKELAERMDRPEKTINEIIKSKASITPDTAIQLERVLGVPAHFWIQREANYQEYLARLRDQKQLSESIEWLNTLPVAQMVKYNWINLHKNKADQLNEVLNFFGVASLASWKAIWLSGEARASFRISLAHTNETGSIASWLRHGEIKAIGMSLPQYNERAFKDKLNDIRSLTINKLADIKGEIKKLCADAGVSVVFTPMIQKATISGSVRWVGNKPLIQLSLRGKFNDRFWFTFFHEAGHIILHGKKDIFLEGTEEDILDASKEKEADDFAANFLIPRDRIAEFIARGDKSPSAIIRFAKELGIHSGIAVGQLQNCGFISNSYLNDLKVKLEIEMD